MECPSCREQKSFFEMNRIATTKKGFIKRLMKLVQYRCNKCLGWEKVGK